MLSPCRAVSIGNDLIGGIRTNDRQNLEALNNDRALYSIDLTM